MKPRQRLEQKQSSRLYLRKRDHRDVIMNDIYHNAIWMKKEQDGEEIDKLVWCKYPKNALMNLGNGDALGWIDTDRQFSYAIGYSGGQRTERIFRLKEICVTFSWYSSTDSGYYTEDGIVWKRFKTNPNFPMNNSVYNFGENMLCYISGTTMQIALFEKDEETEEWTLTNYTTTIPSGAQYCCRTNNGCIIRTQVQSGSTFNIQMYEVRLGMVHERYHFLSVPWRIESASDYAADCTRGDYCGFVLMSSMRRYIKPLYDDDTISNKILAFTSMDDGETWQVQELYSQDTSYYSSWWYNSSNARWSACIRDGYMYAIYTDMQGNVHLWRTLTQTWNEVELPRWVDLPLLQEGGKCISKQTKETIRVAIRPSETENADVLMRTLIPRFNGLNGNSYNIKFKDGKLLNWQTEDEFICLSGGSYKCVFDNMRFISNSKAFAFVSSAYSDATDGADRLQEYDYCVRGLAQIESEVN